MVNLFPLYTQFAIINNSTVVTDADGASMTIALNMLLPTFCKDWNLSSVTATFVGKGKPVPANMYKIYILDNTNIQGALAYHDIISDIPYANVYAKTILTSGGAVLYEQTRTKSTVAQTVCHEVFELLVDPRCTIWWMNPNTGILYAGEVVDPVESNALVVPIGKNVNVTMSDWILPSWQDVQSKSGPYNHMNTLKAPYTTDKNGYVLCIQNGKVNYVFGTDVTPEKKAYYQSKRRITARNSTVKSK